MGQFVKRLNEIESSAATFQKTAGTTSVQGFLVAGGTS